MKALVIFFLLMSVSNAVLAGQDNTEQEHMVIKSALQKVDQLIGTLIYGEAKETSKIKKEIVDLLETNLLPHSKNEESGIYAQADQMVGDQRYAFTTRIRYEHEIIKRRIKALADSTSLPSSQDIIFARKADQLLGLITAHFEQEEKLVIPLLKYGTETIQTDLP